MRGCIVSKFTVKIGIGRSIYFNAKLLIGRDNWFKAIVSIIKFSRHTPKGFSKESDQLLSLSLYSDT